MVEQSSHNPKDSNPSIGIGRKNMLKKGIDLESYECCQPLGKLATICSKIFLLLKRPTLIRLSPIWSTAKSRAE